MARTLKEIGKSAAKKRSKYVGLNNIKEAANKKAAWDKTKEYRDSKPKIEHISIKNREGKGKKLNKLKPWYYLTKEESIAIENSRKSTKMTNNDYNEGYLKQKMKKWDIKHKEPSEDDLFYKEEYPKWAGARFEFACILSQNLARKITSKCKQNLCKFCFDYHKCNEHFMNVLGYNSDKRGNVTAKKAA